MFIPFLENVTNKYMEYSFFYIWPMAFLVAFLFANESAQFLA